MLIHISFDSCSFGIFEIKRGVYNFGPLRLIDQRSAWLQHYCTIINDIAASKAKVRAQLKELMEDGWWILNIWISIFCRGWYKPRRERTLDIN